MMYRRLLVVFAVCTVFGTIGQGETLAQVKPFKMRGGGTVAAFPGLGFTDFYTTGNASHLGRYSSRGSVGATSETEFSGDVTFTAANGDELTCDFAGSVAVSGEPPMFTSSEWDAEFTPTSGTGRFKNASGSFRMLAKTGAFHVLDEDIPFTWSGSGFLKFPKGKKK